MALTQVLRRALPLIALGAAGAFAARRRAEAAAPQAEAPAWEPATSPAPVVDTDAEVVRSVYDDPPVADPAEEDPSDPLGEGPPVDRGGADDTFESATVTDVVDDLLAPVPSQDEIEDATVVDDEPGPGDRPPGYNAR